MDKLVSIIVLCYNHQRFILDNLSSIANQSYKNIQLLINDDCSVDNSWDMIISYENYLKSVFSDVQVNRNQHNIGITKSLNNMIRKAKGDIVKLIAGDDFLDCHYVERIVKAFSGGSDVVMTNAYYVADESTYGNPKIISKVFTSDPMVSKGRLFNRVFEFNFICAPSVAISKKTFDIYGLFDETLPVEDLEYWLRITKDDKISFFYIDDPLVFYRKSNNSMTSDVRNEQYESRNIIMYSSSIAVRKKYKKYISLNRYRIVLGKLIHYYLLKAQDEGMHELQKKCSKDIKELGPVIGTVFRLYFEMRHKLYKKQ